MATEGVGVGWEERELDDDDDDVVEEEFRLEE